MAKKSSKTKSEKKTAKSKSSAKSAASKSGKSKTAKRISSFNSRIKRVVQIDALDQILLNMAAKPYDKILKQIESSKKRLNEERVLALKLGTRILNKAKKVRDSLISLNKNT